MQSISAAHTAGPKVVLPRRCHIVSPFFVVFINVARLYILWADDYTGGMRHLEWAVNFLTEAHTAQTDREVPDLARCTANMMPDEMQHRPAEVISVVSRDLS